MSGWYASPGAQSLHATPAHLPVRDTVPTRCKSRGVALDPTIPTAGVKRCAMCCTATGTLPGLGPGGPVTATIEPAENWFRRAACVGMPAEMWDPDVAEPKAVEAARALLQAAT